MAFSQPTSPNNLYYARLTAQVGRWSALAMLTGLLVQGAVGSGCNRADGRMDKTATGTDTDGEDEEKPTPIVPAKVVRGSMLATISSASTIEAERQATIHAESTGRILSLTVEEGDKVKKGKQLARIKADAQSNSVDRARKMLVQAERDFERAQQLYNSKVIGKEEYDRAKDAVDVAKLDVRDRNRDVRHTKIVAPFSGTITERMLIEGSFVTSGAQVLSIVDFDTLVARVYVPEKEIDQIKVGQIAEVVGKAAKGRRGQGKVQRIAPIVDASTGTVKITVSLPNELAGTGEFLPGMYAEVTLTTAHHKNVVLVPRAAVVRDEDETYLFVVEGDKAKRVRVELGLHNDLQVEVLSGVDDGDIIAVAGQNGLKNDALIKLVDTQGEELEDGEMPEDTAAKKPGDAPSDEDPGAEGKATTEKAKKKAPTKGKK